MHSAVHVGTSAMSTPLSIRRLDSMLIDSPISLGTYYWAMIRRVGLLASKISLNLPSKSSTTCLTLTVMLTFSIIYANCSLPVTKKKRWSTQRSPTLFNAIARGEYCVVVRTFLSWRRTVAMIVPGNPTLLMLSRR
eukprot:Rmarinus@m.26901